MGFISAKELVHYHQQASELFAAMWAHPIFGDAIRDGKQKKGATLCVADGDMRDIAMTTALGHVRSSISKESRRLAEDMAERLIDAQEKTVLKELEPGFKVTGWAMRFYPNDTRHPILSLTGPPVAWCECFVMLLGVRLGFITKALALARLEKYQNPFVGIGINFDAFV